MPNHNREDQELAGAAAQQIDIWQAVEGPPSAHGKHAKVMREIANLSQKSDGIVNDLCDSMKDAMEADSREEGAEIVKSSFDITVLTQTEVLHASRLFFVLRNVMRILGFPVRGGKTIIPHVMNLLFEPNSPELQEALQMYQNYRTLVSPTGQATKNPFHEEDSTELDKRDNNVHGNLAYPGSPARDMGRRTTRHLNRGHSSPIQRLPARLSPARELVLPPATEARFPSRFQGQRPPPGIDTRTGNIPLQHHHRTNSTETQASRDKQNAAMLVKDMPKFSGTPHSGADLVTTKDMFTAAIWQHRVDPTDATDILYHCLEKDARRYYFDNIRGKQLTITAAFQALEDRFDTTLMHAQARALLNSIDLREIMRKHSCDEANALQIVHERIGDTLLKCGKSLQGDDHRIFALQRVVETEEWAAAVLPMTGDKTLTYSSFFTALSTAVSAYIARKKRHSRPLSDFENAKSQQPPAITFYGSQYARNSPPRTERRTRPFRANASRPFYEPRRRSASELAALKARTRCDFCREKGHWRQECPNRKLSMTEAVRARIKDRGGTPTALAEVLYEITREEDTYHEYVNSMLGSDQDLSNPMEALICNETGGVQPEYGTSEAAEDAAAIFEELVQSDAHGADSDFREREE